jgi:hypothetical protein
MDNNTLKEKFEKIVSQLKKLTENYKLNKLNIEVVLYDEKSNKDITLKLNEKHDILISSTSKDSKESKDSKDESKDDSEPETQTDTETENGSLRTLSSDNTLSTSIFRTSAIDDSDNLKTEDLENSKMQLTTDKESRITAKDTELRGGFVKSKKQISSNNNLMNSTTSELNTTIKNIFNKQSGGENLMSTTSDFKPTLKKTEKSEYSATSMSATSDFKVGGMKSEYSATSMSATSDFKVGGMKSDYSATSMSATSDFKVGGMKSDYSATSMSATSDLNTSLNGGFNNMAFSETSHIQKVSKKNSNNNSKVSLSQMDLIRQKIKELDNTSNNEVFQKNRQTGAGNNKLAHIKQTIGINSSSTSSLCE